MEVEVVDIFTPTVRAGNKKLTPDSVPENEKERKIIEILKEFSENIPLYSHSLSELTLWEKVKEVMDG